MPYKRISSTVYKLKNREWVVVKKHPDELKAQRHLTALRINVEAKEK